MNRFVRLREELKSIILRQEEPKPTDLQYLQRLDIMEKQVQAVIELAKGETDRAIPYALEASNLEGQMPRAYGPPYINFPSAQLLGSVYLAAREPALAAEAFGLELSRNRQRTAALGGLAQAHEQLGNEAEAAYYRQKLALIWHLADESVRGESR